ncbi:MAG: FAD-dependent oxidoreductase, partial [Myxococcales bacterium]
IEDAVVLARCLAAASSVAGALELYERERITRANGIVEQSWSFGRIGQIENRAGAFLRNSIVRLTPESMQLEQVRKLMRFEPRV